MKGKSYEKKQKGTGVRKTVFKVTGFSIVAVFMVVAGVYLARVMEEDNHVNRIARYFRCTCEMKCQMIVATCPCKKPGGAKERKAFIRDQLKQGHSDIETIVLSNEKYGGLIT